MITVTDHALVRYLEREKGFNLEPFRAEIQAAAAKALALGTATVRLGTLKLVLAPALNGAAGYTVVTAVRPPRAPHKPKSAPSKAEHQRMLRRNARGCNP